MDSSTKTTTSSSSSVIIITGGGGFLGQCLATTLLEKGTVTVETSNDSSIEKMTTTKATISKIILADIYFPDKLQPQLEASLNKIVKMKGDLSNREYCDSLYTEAESSASTELEKKNLHLSVFHLGAIMSGDGERNFDACINVNLMGCINMLEGARKHHYQNTGFTNVAKFIFVSAGATIGSGSETDYVQKGDIIGDSSRATPHTTYGATKACCELLMTDMSRRGFIDGRGVRLPTIVVRAGKPNGATTGCFSGVIREALAGIDVELPIARDVKHAVTGKRSAVDAMIKMHNVDKALVESILGFDRTVFLPSVALSLGDLEDALMNIVTPGTQSKLGKITYKVDEFLSNVVGGFPTDINANRAIKLGVPKAPDAETLVRDYITDFPGAIIEGVEIIPPSPFSQNTTTTKSTSKVAIITGGGSGIGRAVAQRLAKGGYNVVLAGRRKQPLEETAKSCQQIQPNTKFICIPTDVTIESEVQNLFEKTVEKFGRLDLLFNNAGVNSPRASVHDVTLEDFERVYKTNVAGPFLCAKEAMKQMKQLGEGGRIINNGSISAQVPRPQSTCYTTSKHAMNGLTKCIALDGREINVACGQIDFGNVVSEMSLATNDASKGALWKRMY